MPAKSKIILGTVQFGLEYGINNHSGKPTKAIVNSILDYAFENNICVLDTAEAYGDSQEVIGEYHLQSKNKFDIVTKFSSGRSDLPEDIIPRVHADLKILNVDSLYCYMFHSFSDYKLYYNTYKNSINRLVKEGIIKKIGVSLYTNEEIEELLTYEHVDIIQLPFNLLDNNNQRSFILKKAKEKGIEIHTRSVFLQGLFFKDTNQLPIKLKSLEPYLHEINRISKISNLGLNVLSLNYVIQQETIDHVIIGVDSVSQLKDNIHLLQQKIPSEVIGQIDSIKVEEVNLLNPSAWN